MITANLSNIFTLKQFNEEIRKQHETAHGEGYCDIHDAIFKFTKLVKYNILMLFALLMIQGLVVAYWDVIFHREVCNGIGKWILDDMGFIYTDRFLAYLFFFITFVIFMLLYSYLYIRAINNKFATLPGGEWLTDSIAFWLKIKTPTMRLGYRKGKGGPSKT